MYSKNQIREAFIAAYAGYNNIITPNIEGYGNIGKNIVYELSSGGEGVEKTYAVTFINPVTLDKLVQFNSSGFVEKQEAVDYVSNIRQGILMCDKCIDYIKVQKLEINEEFVGYSYDLLFTSESFRSFCIANFHLSL